MAAISFDPSGTATWPRVRRLSVGPRAHHGAGSRWRCPLGPPGTDLPSMAMGTSPAPSHAAASHRPNARGERGRVEVGEHPVEGVWDWRRRSPATGSGGRTPPCVAPYSAMASHVSAPPMTAHSGDGQDVGQGVQLVPVSRRGSGRSANTAAIGKAASGRSSVTPLGVAANPYPVSRS